VVLNVAFGQVEARRSVLDRAHLGDIEGAFGRVRVFDVGPRLSVSRRLGTLLAIMGPGLVVMAADIDAGTLSVFAQSGQDYGLALVWVLLLLAPVLFVNQEMAARLGAVTGAGHARLILERFGRLWGAFALGDLLVLNLATIVTEFIGVALALAYFGVSRYVSVPVAAIALVAMTATGSFRRWERTVYVLVAVNLVAIPLALASHPHPSAVALSAVPGLGGRVDTASILFILALVGTTVSPWQLFFQQSNVVDKRISARWLSYERTDTLVGAIVFTVCAIAVVVACAGAFAGSTFDGAFTDAGAVARELGLRLGAPAGALFALLLLNASVLGAGCVTLSTSYALGDVFGIRHSLHRRWGDARRFHGSFALATAVAAAIVLIPGAPLGLVTTAVQALAGVLLPSASVFLLLLCNDREVLGPWTNPRWLNALATLVVGVLLVLSALLTMTTLIPEVGVATLVIVLAVALSVVLALFAVIALCRSETGHSHGAPRERLSWSMPPFEKLRRPNPSRARTVALTILRTYLAVAGILLVVKVVELATQT
jgi:NRAMP (natural resistance-associated macrophage protein)-like metal ion transporter